MRIEPPATDELAPDVAELLDLAAARTGTTPPTIALLAHSPDLVGPFLGWAAALALNGALDRRSHEIIALRISHLCRSPFEWDEHVGFAREAGLSDAEIDIIAGYPSASFGNEADDVLLSATDQLHRDGSVDDATYRRLAAAYTDAQIVEVPMVAGQYAMLSMLCGVADVPGSGGAGPS